MKELKVEIFGRVQGVGFRQFVKKQADFFGLKGFVRNREDGSVIVVAQGEREGLNDFLLSIQNGPLLSKVSGVSYCWRENTGYYEGFAINVDNKSFIADQKKSFTNLGKALFGLGNSVPKHVAIIPDGNRRWAKERGLIATDGHRVGLMDEHILPLFDKSKELGIDYVTLWFFSTENWNRSKEEVSFLFNLFLELLDGLKKNLNERNIRFRHVGRNDRLPKEVVDGLKELEVSTAGNTGLNLQICMDYGGRDEITRAVNKMLKLGVSEVNENDFVKYLDTTGIPDPELIIRTSGEKRMSGFMPFQSAYSEFYFSDVYFPEFGPEQLKAAVDEYSRRKRNFGK